MKLKCKARRCLSLFSCNCVSRMTNYVNFKLSKDVEKNPGPTQYNTDHHEVKIRPFMQNSSKSQLNNAFPLRIWWSQDYVNSVCNQKMLAVQVVVSLDVYHINYMAIATILCVYVLLGFNLWERQPSEIYCEQYRKFMAKPNIWIICLYFKGWCTIIQTVAVTLKVTIQIVESDQGFAPLTTVYPVQERNTSSTILL